MNPFAYRTTSMVFKTLANLSKAKVALHGTENIPEGAKIFVINHFTRLETFLMPYYLHKLVQTPIWSLASSEFFIGAVGRFLESVGAVSTKDPHRDRLIVKTLLTNEAGWIIFPEGRMVKNKKIIEKGRYMVSYAGGKHPPHTGAAHLALRTEFYRQRFMWLAEHAPLEMQRLLPLFNLEAMSNVSPQGTYIVPVNITYYPLRARENILKKIAERLVEDLPEKLTEELMTEGAMLTSGVDIDIRFGKAIEAAPYLRTRSILADMHNPASFEFDAPLPSVGDLRKAALKIMQRYMEAIYSMTTVNHDHIFASVLQHSLRDRIRLSRFCRRAFLAIERGPSPGAIHLHHSIEENQNHLLVDDRYSKLEDFLTVAEQSKVLRRESSFIVRNRHKLGSPFDFHLARIDNPVAVMANEVEPLKRLQRKISRLCWTPDVILRSRIARQMHQRAERAFEADYQRFFIQEETKPRHIGRPVLLRGNRRRLGILLCHGYMAAPAEVRTLADYLSKRGYWVYLPRLKGHGTAPEDLARCSYQDWIRSVEEGYILIRNTCRRTVIGGFSTGAALALELASRVSDIAGVFAVSTPLRLQYAASRLAPVVDTWNRLMDRMRWEEAKKEFVENRPENPHINYSRNPIAGVVELERLMDYLEPRLANVQVTALVAQSQQDPVVDPKGSERIFQMLGSKDKQYMAFNFNRHGILLGEGSERVHRVIADFVDQVFAKAAVPARPAPATMPAEELSQS